MDRTDDIGPLRRMWEILALAAVFLAVVAMWSASAEAQQRTVRAVSPSFTGQIEVPINKSQVLAVDVPFSRVTVGSPEIADILPLTNRTVYVLGRTIGTTNLTVYGSGDELLAVVDLVVTYDVPGLRERLGMMFPQYDIEVRNAGGAVLLSGNVGNGQDVSRIMAVAERYAGEAATNLISVGGSQQVMLQVRFAEVARSFTRAIENNSTISGSDFAVALLGGGLAANPVIAGAVELTTGSFTVDLLLNALETQGVATTLAEPNLVALSGETADFLAGGEFPIPVTQEGTDSITIEFKEFGVGLSFTPTVIDGELINLVIEAEVSSVDAQFSSLGVPGVATRRTSTTVELRDGQGFAIAGLLQSDFADNMRGVPWVNQVPVLGALFRSASFQRSETELVVLVTPYIVQPAASPSLLATPLDNFIAPTDFELFLLGRSEGGLILLQENAPGAEPGRGMIGPVGHVIE